jgi:response regulator of citrate/malate metabolism
MGDFILINDYLFEMIREPQITHCQTFKQAQSVLQKSEEKFDMILLDLYLPDKNGQSLIDAVLQISQDAPVIILSGNSDLSFSIKSISSGVDDYLIKDDLRPTTLYKSIVYCIERRKKDKSFLSQSSVTVSFSILVRNLCGYLIWKRLILWMSTCLPLSIMAIIVRSSCR